MFVIDPNTAIRIVEGIQSDRQREASEARRARLAWVKARQIPD